MRVKNSLLRELIDYLCWWVGLEAQWEHVPDPPAIEPEDWL